MPVKTITLVKIAAVGGMVLIGSAIGMKYFILRRFQQAEYFQKSARIVLENKRLVELLGEPVEFGNPDLSDSKTNYSTNNEANFVLPIRGTKKKGLLHLLATRESQVESGTNKGENEQLNKKTDSDSGDDESVSDKTFQNISAWEVRKLELSLNDKPDRKLDLVQLARASQKNTYDSV